MKALLYTTVLLLVLSSCKNIEKMVDKGNYDQAISYAVNRLAGQKNKKTKYVKALERAYAKVNAQDMSTIDKLAISSSVHKYDKIYDLYQIMDTRQTTVFRLDPLVSEDGYIADFKNVNYTTLLAETGQAAAENHYQEAQRLLSMARTTDKYAARQAYQHLSYIEKYDNNYKDTDALYIEAYNIGVDNILVTVQTSNMHPHAELLTVVIHDIDVTVLNDFWTQHHIEGPTSIPYDYTATINVEQILPGYERETYNHYQEVADVEDGQVPVKDLNGNIVKDSLGNTIYTKKYRQVTAHISEMTREKQATIVGRTTIYDNNNSSLVKSIPLRVTHLFHDYNAVYRGDEKALTRESKRKLKSHCDYFPSDYDMIYAMTEDFKNAAYSILDNNIDSYR